MASTTRYKRGDIVLVPFPFTDLSSSKRRPALVISPNAFNDQMADLVVAAITSHFDPHGSETPHNVDRTITEIASTPRAANLRADVMLANPRIWRT